MGKAIGDIVLPEGDTVKHLVHDITARTFREVGYSGLENGEVGFSDAVPLNVDINQFWGWLDLGFITASVEFISEITVSG